MNHHKRVLAGQVLHPETLMMGFGYDPALSEGSVKVPIFQTSTFVFRSAQHGKEFFELVAGLRELREGEQPGLIYSRFNNPDLEILEDRLTVWDGAEAALVFASGMAAIATTLLSLARPGDVIFYNAPIYGGTETLLMKVLPRLGIQGVEFAGNLEPEQIAARLAEARAGLAPGARIAAFMLETPANPTNDLIDIAHCAELAATLADQPGGRPAVIVDNTFLGPLWQSPLAHGADLVVYSLTKYVGGHSDVVAGAVLGSRDGVQADTCDAQRVRHDERPAYWLAADAQPGNAGAAHDARRRERRGRWRISWPTIPPSSGWVFLGISQHGSRAGGSVCAAVQRGRDPRSACM